MLILLGARVREYRRDVDKEMRRSWVCAPASVSTSVRLRVITGVRACVPMYVSPTTEGETGTVANRLCRRIATVLWFSVTNKTCKYALYVRTHLYSFMPYTYPLHSYLPHFTRASFKQYKWYGSARCAAWKNRNLLRENCQILSSDIL